MKISRIILVASFLMIHNGYCIEDSCPEGYELIIENGHLIQRKIGETLHLQDAIRHAKEEAQSIRDGIQESRRQAERSPEWTDLTYEEEEMSFYETSVRIVEGLGRLLGF